jgi:glutamate carboxypeptidase
MPDLNAYFNTRQKSMLALLDALVRIESPSHDKAAVDRMADRAELEMQAAGGKVRRLPGKKTGDIVIGEWQGVEALKPILLMCHMDTVWPLGTLAQRPPRVEGDRFYGPGAYDMKGGLVIALAALAGLGDLGAGLTGPVTLLCTADEETGSHASRPTIEGLARQSRLVLCLEPGMPGGVLKTARKGVGDFTLQVEGRAAHAGSDHQKGVNAIEEMAHHVLALQALTDYKVGTTVNAGVIRGGTTSNVVPASCEARFDFRVTAPEEADRLLAIVEGLKPVNPAARLVAKGKLNRPPMVRDALMIQTFEKASQIAARHGLALQEGSTGGASDANFTAPLGVPTLDGLGVDGDGGHAIHEHALIPSLSRQALLIAALLREW